MPCAIEFTQVSKHFRSGSERVEPIRDLSFRVDVSEAVLVSGPSGSGKTTLLNIVGCLTRPSQGAVSVGGREVSRLADHFRTQVRRHQIGFIFQQFNLLAGYTAVENVAMPLIPSGVSAEERRRRAGDLLNLLGLSHRARFSVSELSGGEQQRVAIARALIRDPWLILADEPTSNVDAESASQILAIFSELKSRKKTIVVASHDPMLVESGLFDRELVLPDGRWAGG